MVFQLINDSPLGQLVTFEFGEYWTIRTRDNKTYSLRDPSSMGNEAYAAQTDYGIVGRAT